MNGQGHSIKVWLSSPERNKEVLRRMKAKEVIQACEGVPELEREIHE